MKNKSIESAGRIFEEARLVATTPFEEKTAHGLAFLAQSIEELHDKVDGISEHGFKMSIVDSVKARLKAVGLIK